jgi:pSer/pThr/pTyr-binding forkhead associated (FHA) protein
MARMDMTEEYLEKTVTLREDPVLTITAGPGTGMVFSLSRTGTTSIGRAKANDVVLGDISTSSQHCRIRPEQGAFVLHDLKSTNGTFVNERRVTRHVLAEGDVIRVGETYLQYRTRQARPS